MSAKEEFIEIYRENIRRDGADAPAGLPGAQKRFFHRPGLGPVPRGLRGRPV